jgi:DNA helicase-2/ATP-dependent DNA helicase PcrA
MVEGETFCMSVADSILDKLNPRQQEAVRYCDGPLLVLAGAGSGKTRVLAHKIAYLIEKGYASPKGILAVTFTNKAAREMGERVQALVGAKASAMQVSTFHSFGLHFLFRNSDQLEFLGLRKGFAIFDRNDSRSLVKKIMEDLKLDPKQIDPTNAHLPYEALWCLSTPHGLMHRHR